MTNGAPPQSLNRGPRPKLRYCRTGTPLARQKGTPVNIDQHDYTEADRFDTKAATSALTAGIVSIILLILFFTPWFGEYIFYASIVIGLVSVVIGIIALTKKQPKKLAVTGIVLGAISALFGIGLLLFALMFVGAISI